MNDLTLDPEFPNILGLYYPNNGESNGKEHGK